MNYIGMDIHKQFTYGVIEEKEGEAINEAKFDNVRN